jgi:hypothetical protein
MRQSGNIAFLASSLLLLVFVINLMLARSASAWFGNVTEMLILFGAAACFGVGTLVRENQRKN